ncbi:MAG: RNA 2',3'-cyclic phosphodiesterase [Dehalococcoidales bacterium]|nr:RNA 2',3'-cyclic phosphodiesterase [Dehalococcoidales bacterium]
MDKVRSFIAIELPDELKTALGQLEAQLKPGATSAVKWVDPNSIHLTLEFLDSIDAARVPEITAAVEKAAQGIPPFHLEVKGLGVFPNPQRARVAWVGVSGETEPLFHLQKQVEAFVAPLGFPTEARPFSAHLTVARVRDYISPDERKAFGELICSTTLNIDYSFTVDSIYLMRSQLTREGAIYSRLSSVRLA